MNDVAAQSSFSISVLLLQSRLTSQSLSLSRFQSTCLQYRLRPLAQTLFHCRKKSTRQFRAVQEELGTLFRCQEPAISNESNFVGYPHFGYQSIIYGVRDFFWTDCFDTHPPKNSKRKNIDLVLSKTSKNIV